MISFQFGWQKYRTKEWSFYNFGEFFLNRFPQIVLLWAEPIYWKSLKKWGQETWWAPHNLWRQVCHAFGGALVALPICWPIFSVLAVFLFSLNRELGEIKQKGFYFKNVLDVFFWTLGASWKFF